jgi:glycosyltransferase involved in cell wall biosynthesis
MTDKEKKLHVLFVLNYFPPMDSVGSSIRAVKLLRYLVPEGWDFTVIAGDPDTPLDPYRVGSANLLKQVPGEVEVNRIKAKVGWREWGPKQVRQLMNMGVKWDWTRQAFRTALAVHQRHPVDIVLATGPPFWTFSLGRKIKAAIKRPLILDVRDHWLDTHMFLGLEQWKQNMWRKTERLNVEAADGLTIASEGSKDKFAALYPSCADKMHFLPNAWDPEDVPPADDAASEKHFVISSAGGYRREDRSPETLLKAIGALARRRADIRRDLRVKLFGDWLYKDFSAAEIDSWGVEGMVEECASLPHAQLMPILQRSSLLLAITSSYWKTSIPGKLYEYWSLRLAPIFMIDEAGCDPGRLVEKFKLGTVVEPNDGAAMEQSIEQYYDAWAAGTPKRISTEGLEAFSRQSIAAEMGKVLKDTLARQ